MIFFYTEISQNFQRKLLFCQAFSLHLEISSMIRETTEMRCRKNICTISTRYCIWRLFVFILSYYILSNWYLDIIALRIKLLLHNIQRCIECLHDTLIFCLNLLRLVYERLACLRKITLPLKGIIPFPCFTLISTTLFMKYDGYSSHLPPCDIFIKFVTFLWLLSFRGKMHLKIWQKLHNWGK